MNEMISKNFTVDDIHIIREKNYEQSKKLTSEEKNEFYNKSAEAILNSLGINYKKDKTINITERKVG